MRVETSHTRVIRCISFFYCLLFLLLRQPEIKKDLYVQPFPSRVSDGRKRLRPCLFEDHRQVLREVLFPAIPARLVRHHPRRCFVSRHQLCRRESGFAQPFRQGRYGIKKKRTTAWSWRWSRWPISNKSKPTSASKNSRLSKTSSITLHLIKKLSASCSVLC